MLRLEDAKKIAHGTNLTSRDQLCVLLALEPADPLQITEIRKRCSAIGLPRLAKKNVSDILGKAKGFVARTTSGWELQQSGLDLVRKLASESKVNLVVTNSSSSLRTHADGLSDPLTKSFVMEAIIVLRPSSTEQRSFFLGWGSCFVA